MNANGVYTAPHLTKRLQQLAIIQRPYLAFLRDNMELAPPPPHPALKPSKRDWEAQLAAYRAALRSVAAMNAMVQTVV